MEQARIFIAIALSFLVFFVWNYFFAEKPTPPTKETVTEQAPAVPPAPKQALPTQAPPQQEPPAGDGPDATETFKPATTTPQLKIDTPLYNAQLSAQGALFTRFSVNDYRETVDANSPPKALIPPENQIGFPRITLAGASLPGLNDAVFYSDTDAEEIVIKDQARTITYTWTSPAGIVVEKAYTFKPDSYLIGLTTRIKNGSPQAIDDHLVMTQFKQWTKARNNYGFEGPSMLLDNKLKRLSRKDVKKQTDYAGQIQWVANESQFFMTGIVPPEPIDAVVRMLVGDDDKLENQLIIATGSIAPGAQKTFETGLYLGPKSIRFLTDIGFNLKKVVHFGFFVFLGKPCLWFLNKIYSVIPNYGVAIIIMTIILKILLWPLGTKSYQSMNEMKRVQPLMTEIREKYKDDKKKQNQEMMALYKTYKINPMGGCLPMLMQLPVFFALYKMLYEAIELRHAPFFGWINDLSAPDRLFSFDFAIPLMQPPYGIPVLTLIMGASMFLQQKMSPPPGDPTQAKIMMIMPIAFTFIFINFSSGLVLYWLVNNILSMGQQFYIQKKYA